MGFWKGFLLIGFVVLLLEVTCGAAARPYVLTIGLIAAVGSWVAFNSFRVAVLLGGGIKTAIFIFLASLLAALWLTGLVWPAVQSCNDCRIIAKWLVSGTWFPE